MKSRDAVRRAIGATVLAVCLIVHTNAQIPRTLSYQGILSDTLGTPKPDGAYAITFRLYNVAGGGTALWSETKSLQVRRGLFSTILGDQTAFPATLTFDRQYWLSIQVGADPELSPRLPLSSVGYSLNALRADTARVALNAGGQSFADSARIAGTVPNNSITAPKIAPGQVVKSINNIRDAITLRAQGGATITTSADTITINAGSGGGGTGVQGLQNTNNTLDIINPTGPTVTANLKVPLTLSANVSTVNSAIITASNTAATNLVHGVMGRTSSSATDAAGVQGEALANTGQTAGVIGRGTASPSGTGVAGFGAARGVYGESNLGYGIYGSSTSLVGVYGEGGTRGGDFSGGSYGVFATSPTGWGVWGGTSSNILNSTGVYGVASASSGEIFGVRGIATSSSQGTGVKGEGGANGVVGSSASGVGVSGAGGQFGGSFTGGAYGVFGIGPLVGVWGVTNSTVDGSSAVEAVAAGSSGLVYGVKGVTNSTTSQASGVRGEAATSSGQTIGVEGVSNASPNGTGVAGRGGSTGGYFSASSPSSTGVIGYGVGTGIFGQAFAAGGTGVEGAVFNNLTASSWGVWGTTPSPGQAGHFSGNVVVVGNVTKSGGSFKIDHPLDPANKYLYHSFVESPDMMNIYNGNVVLDARGEAVVELPAWFEALNKEFRYQLTCMGGFAPVYVAEEIQNNRFMIAGGKAGMKVSWQVTGIRHDPYADKHRIPVEENKPSVERGHYLHPDVYGQPEEKSIEWALKPEQMRRLKEERENPNRSEMSPVPANPSVKPNR